MKKRIFWQVKRPKIYLLALMILMTVFIPACGPAQKIHQPVSAPTPGSPPALTEPLVSKTATTTPGETPGQTVTVSPTLSPVIVTAVKGNVFIRRGPDLAYNPVSVLMDGQSASALKRDVLSKWLQISISGHPGETGWISIQTHFITVNGEVKNLPETTPTDWPVLAYLRNCTSHLMKVEPAGIFIPAANNFPDNEVQINPGVYTIHDIEVDGSSEVMEVEIKEGLEVDIRDDGNGDHKKCVSP